MRRVFCVLLLLVSMTAPQVVVAAESPQIVPVPNVMSDGIQIESGSFGTLGAKRKLDIAARLQELCGTGAHSCHVYCSETSFGRYSLGRKPICRVTYRCGTEYVHSVEAMREEPLLMKCPELRAESLLAPLSPTAN